MKSILDPKFRYVRSEKTDLAATFARIRKEQQRNAAEAQAKVQTIPQRRKA